MGTLQPSGFLRVDGLGDLWPEWNEYGKQFLFDLLHDPLQAAKAHAALTGECSFCGAELSDERSKSVGYGPVCAENYGLPWGDFKPVNLDDLF